MGVKDLSKELRASDELVTSLSNFSGKILGVDASIWLNKAISVSPEISTLFHQEPTVTVGHLIDQFFDRLHSVFIVNNIKLLFVIDGARNPLKSLTTEARKRKRSDATEEMLEMIKMGDADYMKKIASLKRTGTYVRNDILADFVQWCIKRNLKYVCAYMEAEWELCRLEKDGVIDGIVSEDSDCFVLGCKTLIQLLDIEQDPLEPNCSMTTGSCWVNYVSNILSDPSPSELADFAVLLGSDYLDRAVGVTVHDVRRIFADWRTIKEETLQQIESNGSVGVAAAATVVVGDTQVESNDAVAQEELTGSVVVVEGDAPVESIDQVDATPRQDGIPYYVKRFTQASNIYQYAPCFCVKSLFEESSIRDAFWSDSYGVDRGNLNTIPEGTDEVSLFGFDPNTLLPPELQPDDFFMMRIWIRTLTPIDSFIIPLPENDKGETLPWGCHLDFEKVPILMQPTQTLIRFLECRGLSYTSSNKSSPKSDIMSPNARGQLESTVGRVVTRGVLGPPILPLAVSTGVCEGQHIAFEVLSCNQPIIWETNSSIVFQRVKEVKIKFDEKFIDQHLGTDRNGVKEKAWERIEKGHFDLRTLESTTCNCRTTNGIECVRIFSIKCTPSARKDAYTIYSVFRQSDDSFLQAPASRCNCPVGRFFCSHMLAFIVLFGMIQSLSAEEDLAWFEGNHPPPIQSVNSLCIPLEYAIQNDI